MLLSIIKAKFATAHCNWCESKAIPTGDAVESCWLACTGIFYFNFFFFKRVSHRWHFHSENRRAFGYLCKHTTAPTSCFLLPGERSDKQSDSGVACGSSGQASGGLLKQDAAACSSWLGKWHNKLDLWGNCAFLHSSYTKYAFIMLLSHTFFYVCVQV